MKVRNRENQDSISDTFKSISRLLIKASQITPLLKNICEGLKTSRKYKDVSLCIMEKNGEKKLISEAGKKPVPYGNPFLATPPPLCIQKIIKEKTPLLMIRDTDECIFCPMHDCRSGWASVLTPLIFKGEFHGILFITIQSEVIAVKTEVDFLLELGENIAACLNRISQETALEKSEQLFRDITNNAVTGIAILQADKIVFQNPEYKKIFGPLSKSATLFLDSSIHPDDAEKTQLFQTTITQQNFTSLCVDFRICSSLDSSSASNNSSKVGQRITSVFCRAALTEFKGKPAVLLNVMDMTKPRELENLLRIQDKMTSLGRIAAGIAHEIRNPLSGINIYLKSLEKYSLERNTETESKIISKIQSASNRIESVIKRVMDFSKPGELKPILVDINLPVQNAIDLAAVTLRKSGVQIETSLASCLPQCYLDSPMIEQVMLNLITNAAEAMKTMPPGSKTIAIKTQCHGQKKILVQVEDSGPGISEIHRDKIFDPFYTTKNSSGIGLSICRRIINDHRGNLGVYDSLLGGAGFVIEIPVTP